MDGKKSEKVNVRNAEAADAEGQKKITKKTPELQHGKDVHFSYITFDFTGDRPVSLRCAFFLACVAVPGAAAQTHSETPETEVVATVGPRMILARDVLERIELMPWPGKDRPSMRDSVALQATLSLVAEKLLSLQASSLRIGLDEESAARFASLERALARDELYRQEIAGRVAITPGESSIALRRYAVQLRLAVFAVRDEQDARQLVRQLSAPARGGAGAPRVTAIRTDTVMVSYGELARAHEDVGKSVV